MATITELSAVSVVVPAYQESASIVESLVRLHAVLAETRREFELIVVSDGSTDDTAQLARDSGVRDLTVIEYHPNRGKGFALRTGFASTSNPLVVFIDGDLDLHPSVLPGYLDMIDSGEADVVVGSKMHPDSQVDYPLKRRLASRAFRLATRMMLGLNLGDTQTGLKAMRRDLVAPIIDLCDATGFSFDLELLAGLSDHGARVVEAPILLDFDFTSKVSASTAFHALLELARVARHRRKTRGLERAMAGER